MRAFQYKYLKLREEKKSKYLIFEKKDNRM